MSTPPAHDAREVLQDLADRAEPHPDKGDVIGWAVAEGLVDGGELTREGRRWLRSVGGLP